MNFDSGSVSLHDIPMRINTPEGREEYVQLELLGNTSEYMIDKKITIQDFRGKK